MEERTVKMLQKHRGNATGAAATVLSTEGTYEKYADKIANTAVAYFADKFGKD